MPKPKRTTLDILRSAQATLETAELGLKDLVDGPPNRKLAGLRNLTVFGRSVTNVLQGLRSVEPEFDVWYGEYVEEMEYDPLLKYFYDLRSVILKEGTLKTAVRTHIRRLVFPRDMTRLGPRPPFAKSFFFGDSLGGAGWEVELPDGTKRKYYVELPYDIGSVTMHFPNPPSHHLGKNTDAHSIEKLSLLYIGYLQRMVKEAKVKFQ